MSAQQRSRAFEQGRVKALRRIRRPLTLLLPDSAPPRNRVARALSVRASGAGRHIRSQGAQRRADRVALTRLADHALRDRKERNEQHE
jgi:hypothetical protein